MIAVWIPLLSKLRRISPPILVLRCPPGMTSASAIVTDSDDGHPIIYWAGCQQLASHGGLILGSGVQGCYLSIGAAHALGDERVLVREGGIWVVAVIQRPGAVCECGRAALQDRGDRRGPCQIHPDCLAVSPC